MKISIVCHGNIARSQILHHYLAHYAKRAAWPLQLYSCGTAPWDAYQETERLLAEVRTELERRGIETRVERNTLDETDAEPQLADSDVILAADEDRRRELVERLGDQVAPEKIKLFYDYIDEGARDFVDTYDAKQGAQDPERFTKCFDELERIARLIIDRLPHPQ